MGEAKSEGRMAWYDVAAVAFGVIGSMLQLWIQTLRTGNLPNAEFLLFPGSDGLFQVAIYDNEDYRVPFHPTQDVKFLLYTPSNRKHAFRIFVNNEMIFKASPFIRDIPVRILIHGFGQSSRKGDFPKKVRKTFMAEEADPCNLIYVDWEKSAVAPLYNTAAANTKDVGHEVSKLVYFLISNGANLSTVHIVGFSLGAHVAGFAAKHFRKKYGQMLPRITAACSHMRAWRYFLESVASADRFLAVPCPDNPTFKAGLCGDCDRTKRNCSVAIPMGFWTPSTARGNYYLSTKRRKPYSYT
ncbi:pancreatic triacylglycerol lipase-like isoform X5 [Artemia franciscana]|uniref:pancreatic triacylglycerol lipase-like isoform X5 n=1 Tax=Artemia franciscana TaxID=6661 RepID=UPI0032DB4F1A